MLDFFKMLWTLLKLIYVEEARENNRLELFYDLKKVGFEYEIFIDNTIDDGCFGWKIRELGKLSVFIKEDIDSWSIKNPYELPVPLYDKDVNVFRHFHRFIHKAHKHPLSAQINSWALYGLNKLNCRKVVFRTNEDNAEKLRISINNYYANSFLSGPDRLITTPTYVLGKYNISNPTPKHTED